MTLTACCGSRMNVTLKPKKNRLGVVNGSWSGKSHTPVLKHIFAYNTCDRKEGEGSLLGVVGRPSVTTLNTAQHQAMTHVIDVPSGWKTAGIINMAKMALAARL